MGESDAVLTASAATSSVLRFSLTFLGGKPFQILEWARTGEISLTVSEPILQETKGVLRNKFRWTEAQIEEGLRRITAMARIVKPVVLLDVIKDDPPDNRILECAVTGGSDYIITGDSHLLRLGRYDAIRILKPAGFLDLVHRMTL